MLGSPIRSRAAVARRLLVLVPFAVLVVVTGTGATLPSKSISAPTNRASTEYVNPPVITQITSVDGPSYQYDFTGYVTDPGNNVGGLTVTFSGADGLPNGQTSVNLPVTPNPGSTMFGTFTVTVQLQANTGNSPLTYDWSAVAGDGNGNVSGEVSCEVTLNPEP